MRPLSLYVLLAAATLAIGSAPAFADTTEPFDPAKMWECPQADGSSMYTNKERAGCKLMTLKPLSIVPSLDNMPTYRPAVAMAPHYELSGSVYPNPGGLATGGQNVPDWARDWQASTASNGSVHAEVCSMYGEWINLNQKTRGGFFFGSDPSYGGDLSGRNQRGASYSFYDNARYHALSRMFGTGFVPVGCQ